MINFNGNQYEILPPGELTMMHGDIWLFPKKRMAKEVLMPRGRAWGLENQKLYTSTRTVAVSDELWNDINGPDTTWGDTIMLRLIT